MLLHWVPLVGSNPLSPPFQTLLDAVGQVIAFIYRLIPNYGVAIIVLTLAVRVVLLPLAVKQIRSMQAMQVIQPKLKELQRKYKGDRQKLNEAMMNLYKEHGYNPLSGCFPLLAQFPVLIALFAVLRVPSGLSHIPQTSALYSAIQHQHTSLFGSNLQCSAQQAGRDVTITLKAGQKAPFIDEDGKPSNILKCGRGIPVRIPYFVFAGLMIATTYFQQRQMQRASPAAGQQQQAITRIMPLLFGVWGFIFPAGLVIYWTTANVVQIGQQYFMLVRQGAPLAPKDERPGTVRGDGARRELRGKITEPGKSAGGAPKAGSKVPRAGNRRQPQGGQGTPKAKPASGSSPGSQGGRGGGGRNAGNRKKRRKR